jgi:hypothetical protein
LASALTTSDLYGDIDGMGISGLSDGAAFDWTAVTSGAADAGTITDQWMYADHSWTHTYDISGLGTLTSATLEIATGGQGWYGLTSIYIDDILVGTLTDGDTNDGGTNENLYQVDTFDLLSLGVNFQGASTLKTVHVNSGDGWALDYSLLTISDDAAPVPEPATMLLFGTGIAGFVGSRLRREKKA